MTDKSLLKMLGAAFVCVAFLFESCAPQVEATLELGQESVSVSYEGAEKTISVVSNSSWTVSSSDAWVTTSTASGNGDGSFTVTVAPNLGTEGTKAPARTSTVVVSVKGKSVELKVSQASEAVVFGVLDGTVDVPEAGGTVSISVKYNVDYKVSIPSDATWIRQVQTKSAATDKLVFSVDANEGAAREVTILFVSDAAGTQKATVRQAVSSPFKGEGTASSPFVIDSAYRLANLSKVTNDDAQSASFLDKYYSITADIDMSGVSFTPVAQNSGKPFKGVIDGGGHSISKLKIANEAQAAAGFVAYAEGATVKGIKLVDADIDSKYVYCGGIVGFASAGTIVESCTVSGQVREYTSGISVSACDYAPVTTANAGYSGGIVGLASKSTVKDCRLEGSATFYGKFSGGIVGMSYNSSIISCSVAKECPVNVYYHFGGGIVGRAMGADNIIKGCSFEGNYTTVGYAAGGIVGQLLGGKVQECVLGSYADFGGDKFFVGGIVGSAQPVTDITVDHCASYGRVRGSYCVSGIVGYAGQGSGASSDKDLVLTSLTAGHQVTISSCAAIGTTVTATGGNSAGYPIAAGILGWSHTNSKLMLNGCYSAPTLIQTTYGSNKYGVLSGICAYQNGTSGATIRNCYSSVSPEQMLICGDKASSTETNWYAGIHIRCTQATTVTSCYTQEGMRVGYSSSAATETDCNTFTVAQMTDGTLLNALKASADGTEWVAGTNGYPTIQGIPADPNVKKKASKRVSVIGDSISTFKGWVPGGYSCHYPTTDGALTLVNETYWYRLIHDFMKDAEFDTNIAYSGSTVTNTTTANYQARYGTASNSWWHNSFTERFAACGGMGTPDIILIHGGTNDWAHDADPLAPNMAIRNDASNIYGGSAPSADVMNAIYATADAASTRTAVNALPDGTFCEAYVKLMCQIRERYPQCKVVCIIGDYLSQSIEQSIIQIAAHYGAKTVNLFRVNGFNDLGGYTPETLKLGEAQPNMPKHDHTDLSVATGCHPGSQAMLFMANKIYTELGAWLEE